jgi:DUF438 domain-containing protein
VSTNLEKIETLKTIIKLLHEGKSVQELKEQYSDLLRQVSPLEIPFLEQQLVREGLVSVNDILKLCDLHVELFRESLETRTLQGVPSGHPLDLLLKENDWIAKRAEILGMYASSLLAADQARAPGLLENIDRILGDLKKLRLHYRKLQMIVFPYLERWGIITVPRVFWGREDQAIRKLRELSIEIDSKLKSKEAIDHKNVTGRLLELSREIQDLAFREAKILFPALWALLGEGEWVAIHEIAGEFGYIVDADIHAWKLNVEPVLPYQIKPIITDEQLARVPEEFRQVVAEKLVPDDYQVNRDGDLNLSTGFLNKVELEGIFKALPLEITFADTNRRVRFFTKSEIAEGFPRAKTIIGRRLEFCHPPRLENYVKLNVEILERGQEKYRVFWTRMGDRILRVIVSRVNDSNGQLVGILEIVEDFTEILNNRDEILKKVVVL